MHRSFVKTTTFFFLFLLLAGGCFRHEQPDNSTIITIGTFNVAWLGDGVHDRIDRREHDYQCIADVIKETHADIMGLQEIENSDALAKVLHYLPDYSCMVGHKGRQQNVAVLYRTGLAVRFVGEYSAVALEEGRNRPGLVLQCKAGNFDWIMMIVHFKSTSHYDSTADMKQESREVRERQAEKVESWVQSILAGGKEKDVIIIGDFNDSPANKKTTLSALLADSNLNFLTFDLKSCERPVWNAIDHIVVSRQTKQRYVPGTMHSWNTYDQYPKETVRKISDHCPVVAQFEIMSPDND